MQTTAPFDHSGLPRRLAGVFRALAYILTGGPEIRILLVRHGESHGNVEPEQYVLNGDHNVGETDLGWRQSAACGEFLDGLYTQTQTRKWPVLYLSGYRRTLETFAGMYHAMKKTFPGVPRLFEDTRLVEKFFGAASAMHFPDASWDKKTIDTILAMSKKTFENDPLSAANIFGESTRSTLGFVKSFIDGTLQRDIKQGETDFLIVTHGAVIQSFIMNWAHVPYRQKNAIGNPGNCDVIEIRGKSGRWTITKIYDGVNMKPASMNMLAGIKYPTVDDLPPVPDFLKAKP